MGLATVLIAGLIKYAALYLLYVAALVLIAGRFRQTRFGIPVCVALMAAPIAWLAYAGAVTGARTNEENRFWRVAKAEFPEFCRRNFVLEVRQKADSLGTTVLTIDRDVYNRTYGVSDLQRGALLGASPFRAAYEKRFIQDWVHGTCGTQGADPSNCTRQKWGYDFYMPFDRSGSFQRGSHIPPEEKAEAEILREQAVPSEIAKIFRSRIVLTKAGAVLAEAKISRLGDHDYCPNVQTVVSQMIASVIESGASLPPKGDGDGQPAHEREPHQKGQSHLPEGKFGE